MAHTIGCKTDQDHEDGLEAMIDDGQADSMSEALRQTSRAELARQGYLNGTHKPRLSGIADEFAKAFAWIGIGWLGVTMVYPVGYRLGAVFAFLAAFGCMAVGRVVEMEGVGFGRGEQA